MDDERVGALEAALEAIGPARTAVRARLLANLASELHFTGVDRRIEVAQEALAIARDAGDPLTLAHALGAVWFATWGTENTERGGLADELSQLTGRLGDRSMQFEAAVAVFLTAQGQGDVERATSALETAGNIADELGQPALRWRAALFRAHFTMMRGSLEEVEQQAEEAVRLGEAAGQPEAYAFGMAPVILVRCWKGRPADAMEIALTGREQFPASISFQMATAWIQAQLGEHDAARLAVADLWRDDFSRIPRDSLWLIHMHFSARLACLLGDDDAARSVHALLLPHQSSVITSQFIWVGPVALVLGMLAAELGRYDDADTHFGRAIEIQERIGRPPLLVHTRLEWARMLARRSGPDDTDRARVLLAVALPHARELDMTGIEPEIEELLAALNGRPDR